MLSYTVRLITNRKIKRVSSVKKDIHVVVSHVVVPGIRKWTVQSHPRRPFIKPSFDQGLCSKRLAQLPESKRTTIGTLEEKNVQYSYFFFKMSFNM